MTADNKTHFDNLHHWIIDVTRILGKNGYCEIYPNDAMSVCQGINTIASLIKDEYPFFSNKLSDITKKLFPPSNCQNPLPINTVAFGELFIIEQQIYSEPINMQFWINIHPRICKISKSEYADGHFDSAAEKAIKEVEARLRELFTELKPSIPVPTQASDIIGALLSENGAFHFIDTSTPSGKNYRRGIQNMFEGAFAAYRNPATHANIECSKRESFERIVVASQLMYVLDMPNLPR